MGADTATAVALDMIEKEIVPPDTVRVSKMLDKPDKLVLLSEYNAGGEVKTFMGRSQTYVTYPRLQVLVRGAVPPDDDYLEPRVRAIAVWHYISSLVDVVLSGDRYINFEPNGIPEMLRRDERDRIIFVSNFTVTKETVP